jgi:hypothetical protein
MTGESLNPAIDLGQVWSVFFIQVISKVIGFIAYIYIEDKTLYTKILLNLMHLKFYSFINLLFDKLLQQKLM